MNKLFDMSWFIDEYSDKTFTITEAEFQEFLSGPSRTYGLLQGRTIGQMFCEKYKITDGLLCAFVNDDYCIDRIRTFYVRR